MPSAASLERSWSISTPMSFTPSSFRRSTSPTRSAQNLILPAGTAKMASTEYQVAQQQPARSRRDERPAESRWSTAPRSISRTWRRCATGIGADQHRPHERNARRAADGDAQRQGVHAGGGQQVKAALPKFWPACPPELKVRPLSISRCSCAPPSRAWCGRRDRGVPHRH